MKRVLLGELATFASGGTPSRKKRGFYTGEIPWITGADIDAGGEVRARSFITREALAGSTATVVPAGTLLLVTRTSVGKVGVPSEDTAFSQDITAIRHDSTKIHRDFLMYFLRSKQHYFSSRSRGATIKGVTRETLAHLPVPLPPLGEQRRVATILAQADVLGATRHKVLNHLGSLPHSIFREMFADVPATSTVSEQASLIRTGPFGSQLLHSEFVDDGIAVLGLDNVVGNEFRWGGRRFITPTKYEQLRRYTVMPGDVLISIMGTTGRCVVVPDDIPVAINTKHICAITPETSRLHPTFLRAAFLWHPDSLAHLRRQTKGSIMDGLNMGIIKTMPIPIPPLAAQQQFALRAEQVAASRGAVARAATSEEQLFASLQSRAFRGEL